MKIRLIGDTSLLERGLSQLLQDMNIQISDDGYPLYIKQRKGPLVIKKENGYGELFFEKKVHFFRGMGLWLENHEQKQSFERTEQACFQTSGVMVDCSRNGVLRTGEVQSLLRKMALMGLNVMMIYTEDTYEVPEYPYFGYMRGRYNQEELAMCDAYADDLGIEMIPCIQTLAHLTEALKWNYAINLRDTEDILLAGEPQTRQFLEHIITAASKPFRSKRMHIGMDEAHQLGLGKYLDKNGYRERFGIMSEHLQDVVSIAEKYDLKTMIWSDMYFRLGSKDGAYYDLEASIPDEVVSSIPDTQLVYWDYYHTDQSFYQAFIQKHQSLGSTPVFAGGSWTWNGISPNYGKARATTEPALLACKEEGVQEVFLTMWGDNGAETPLSAGLPMLQLFAEHAYQEFVSEEHLQYRFGTCAGGYWEDFMILNQLDETPGVSTSNLHESNPSKFLLWQDVLIGLYDKNVHGLPLNEHYKKLSTALEKAIVRNPQWQLLFCFYHNLARVLNIKAEIGIQLKQAYDADDTDAVRLLISEVEELKQRLNTLRESHRDLWFSINKPFGWEVLEIRYGGLHARLETAQYRLEQWLQGEITAIEELEAERLEFAGPYEMPEGSLGRNIYRRIVTAGNLS
ncbi:beta-N-acetylhexosaminidase [Salisediminibacterium beveridgei]|uniref:Glycoside Hydrolase Family n=1 Tax=Salisediminibacterium beveridgei TaxID=632773 RepID=A0A1D7QZR7_9BACI|nr:beta-N-acetylhexosaminidase [Salisediminibacterium beveridgei]AOM84499.1 Glycoside Hydrolase Family [Salisediminibacterium beveridgei]